MCASWGHQRSHFPSRIPCHQYSISSLSTVGQRHRPTCSSTFVTLYPNKAKIQRLLLATFTSGRCGENQMVVSYQPILVLLSVGVAIIGSFTSLAMTAGSHDIRHNGSWEAGFSLANGGLIMGTTIWSMHFTAMMAVQFPVLI